MKWVELHNGYWELVGDDEIILAVIHRGRKTFFCRINSTGESHDFDGYGFLNTVNGAFKKAKKWCEGKVK